MLSGYKVICFLVVMLFTGCGSDVKHSENNTLIIRKSDDFELTGTGTHTAWNKTSWTALPSLSMDQKTYTTKAKLLYSDTGIYFLFFCEDKKINATMQADFLDLWNEDVIELFLQSDSTEPAYFEYELSPLNYELPITIYNEMGKLNSWIPFHYEGDRKTRHAVTIQGGIQKPNADIQSWTSEIFIPYRLLKPLLKSAPSSGTRWKGNLNRIDYDQGETLWAWQRNSGDFHEYDKFGVFEFE
jgi:hypothetical protein